MRGPALPTPRALLSSSTLLSEHKVTTSFLESKQLNAHFLSDYKHDLLKDTGLPAQTGTLSVSVVGLTFAPRSACLESH